MFTGLIQAVAEIKDLTQTPAGVRLRIDPKAWTHHPEPGESICVAGCCLTLAEPVAEDGLLIFDAIPQTLRSTTLGDLQPASRVNLESCCTPTTLLGGHIVQGHIDGVAEITSLTTEGEYRIRVRPPRPLMEFVTPKGSICIDGVSMTIAGLDVADGWFEVALIPTTLRETTLGDLESGSRVNLEMDVLAKTLVHWARNRVPESTSAPSQELKHGGPRESHGG